MPLRHILTIIAFETKITMLNIDTSFEEKRELKIEQLVHSVFFFPHSVILCLVSIPPIESKLHKGKSYFLCIFLHFTKMLLKFDVHTNHLGILLECRFCSAVLGWGLRRCNSDQPPGLLILLIGKPHCQWVGRQHPV